MSMTNEQIRIAVAEALGWECYEGVYVKGDGSTPRVMGDAPHKVYDLIPNYPESLDACAEFENDAPEDYWIELWRVVLGHKAVMNEANLALFGKATPLQRCEALLRLKGKWVEA